jgi:shikimate dehydrogenase
MSAAITRLGVTGWPVAHSLSPAMHNAALEAVGLGTSWHYQLLPITPELFDETVRALPASGFRGVNVTIPHKLAALALANDASVRAAAMGSANTLLFGPDGTIHADNTDGPGMLAALSSVLPGGASGRRVAVLGAGGTSRSAVWALLDAGAATVKVWNRTPVRAAELCAEVGGEPITDPADLNGSEIIINCTSVGLHDGDELEQLPVNEALLGSASVIIDFVYKPAGTALGHAAQRLGVPLIDGLELLVRQGVEAFTQFTGQLAPLDVMCAAVRG